MTNGDSSERFDRIEGILEPVVNSQREMAARQHYHDEALERHADAASKDGENIRALARIAEIHERRLTALEDGEAS